MADYNLGTAQGKIKIDYDGKGVDQAEKDLGRLDKSNDKTRQGFTNLAQTSGAAAVVLGAGLALSVKKAIDFEKQISAIGAVSNATGAQMEALRKKALQLGADTVFSATDAAAAMEELAKAGIALPDILNGAADATVALAAAGGIALPEAAELAADAMNSFRLSASAMPKVADLIAGAANSSSISVGDFGIALKQVGAVAALVGVSFEDTAAAIALMGKFGIKGSDAGTSLKVMLLNLQPATEKQKTLFKELGLVTKDGANQFFNAQGKLKSLAEVSDVLQNALKGQTQQQKLATLELIFGQDAIRAAAILSESGAKGFNDMAKAMGAVSAEDVAAKRLDNTAGAIEQMKGSLETAAIALGTIFLPVIKQVAQFIAFLANKFSDLDPKWQKFIGFMLIAAAAAAALIAVVAAIGAAVIGIGASVVGLKIAAVVLGIVAVITLLVVAFKKAWDNSEELRRQFAQNIQPAVQKLADAFAKAWPTIKTLAEGMGTILVVVLKALGVALLAVLKVLAPVFGKLIEGLAFLVAGIPAFVEGLQSFIRVAIQVGKIIGLVLIAPFYLLYQAGVFVFHGIQAIVQQFISFWVGVWGVIGGPIISFINLWRAIAGAFGAVISAIFMPWINAFREGFAKAFNFIMPFVKMAIDFVVSTIGGAVSWLMSKAVPIWNIIQIAATVAFNLLWTKVQQIWAGIQAVISFAVKAITATMGTISAIVDRVRNFFNQLKAAAEGGTGSLIAFVAGIPGRITSALGNMAALLYGKGRDLIEGFIDGIKSMVGKVAGAVADTVKAAARFLPGSPAKEGPFSGQGYVKIRGQHLIEDFTAGISGEAKTVADALASVINSASTSLPSDFSGSVMAVTNPFNTGTAVPAVSVQAGGEAGAEGMSDAAIVALLEQLIKAVEKIAPGVGAELASSTRTALQSARSR